MSKVLEKLQKTIIQNNFPDNFFPFEIDFVEKSILKINKNNHIDYFEIMDISTVNIKNLDFFLHKNQEKLKNKILVKDYISYQLANELKENNIFYLDISGNCYINNPYFFIWVNGQKNIQPKEKKRKHFWTFSQAKLVFALLVEPQFLNVNYRYIAKELNISLGSISENMKALEERNFIVSQNKNQKILVNQKILLDEFLAHFQECITPKLQQKRYRTLDKKAFDLENLAEIIKNNVLVTGEYFAEKITNHNVPKIYTFYIPPETHLEIMRFWKLVPDEEGDIILKTKFWTSSTEIQFNNFGILEFLLAYIDLIESEETRNLETAKIIYDKYLSNHFG